MFIKAQLNNAKLKALDSQMEQAGDYSRWRELALQHDALSGKDTWKLNDDSDLYDSAEIRVRYNNLRRQIEDNNLSELLYALNEGIHGNMSGMGRPILYTQAKLGTKQLIDDYVNAIVESLVMVAEADECEIPFAEKLDFFRRASHCYGQSSLMMSGGAGLIYFHHGVVQALVEGGVLPKVISGSSAGSWVAAQLGTLTDEELLAGYFKNKVYDLPTHLNPLKVLMGQVEGHTPATILEQAVDEFSNDMTFQEAYEHTGRYINISIAPAEKHQTSRLMNAITSPSVYIRSAVMASSSIPGVLPSVTLYAKGKNGKPKPYLPSRKWVDGSLADDLPAKRLARLFGVNHYIVSLINPLALPFVADPKLKHSRGIKRTAAGLAMDAAQEALLTVERMSSKFSNTMISPVILMANAMIDQKYTGDINIFLEKKHYRWRDVLFGYTTEEGINTMLMAGLRGTWPKISMIRNATLIAKTIDEILQDMDRQELMNMQSNLKAHITPAV